MSDTPRVNRQQVFEAAQALLDSGTAYDRITASRLQQQAGHGSTSTWHKYLKQWREATEARQLEQALHNGQQSIELNQLLAEFAGRISCTAQREAQASLARERHGFNAQHQHWQQDIEALGEELEQLQQQQRQALAEIEQLSQQRQRLQHERDQQQQREQQQQQQLSLLRGEKKALQDSLRSQNQKLHKATERMAAAEALQMLNQQQLQQLSNERDSCRQQLQAQQIAHAQQAIELQQLQASLSQSEQHADAADSALQHSRQQQQHLREQLAECRGRLASTG